MNMLLQHVMDMQQITSVSTLARSQIWALWFTQDSRLPRRAVLAKGHTTWLPLCKGDGGGDRSIQLTKPCQGQRAHHGTWYFLRSDRNGQ